MLNIFKALRNLKTPTLQERLATARCAYESGHFTAAHGQFTEINELFPDNIEAKIMMDWIRARSPMFRTFPRVIEQKLENILSIIPKDITYCGEVNKATILSQLVQLHLQSDMKKALDYFNQGLELNFVHKFTDLAISILNNSRYSLTCKINLGLILLSKMSDKLNQPLQETHKLLTKQIKNSHLNRNEARLWGEFKKRYANHSYGKRMFDELTYSKTDVTVITPKQTEEYQPTLHFLKR